MSVLVTGVGTSTFAKQPDVAAEELARAAIVEALADAGRGAEEIEAVYVGTVFGPSGSAARVLQSTGLVGVPTVTLEAACASSSLAVAEAFHALTSGRYETVLCLGLEHMTSRFGGAIHPESTDREGRTGLAMPALYAMSATRYLAEGLVTPEQMAAVSVKNHRHALGNPRAAYGMEVTIDEVLASPMISDPLTLLQCCPVSDGASAAVLSTSPARRGDVELVTAAAGTGRLWDHRSPNVWGFDLAQETATSAYDQAGMGPEDIDVFEVHDAFTIGEIVTTEALGLAPIGSGGALAAEGVTSLGGRSPVNPSGGLLSRGHPLGATGLAQIAEVTWQLRGTASGRQVDGARVGVVETLGGGAAGVDGNACVIAVLRSG